MTNWMGGLATLTLLALPAMGVAQTADRAERPVPVQALLEARAELGLSAEQVVQLESIHARLQEQNQPLLEEMRAAAPAGGSQRGVGMRERMGAMTPEQREQMREHMGAMTPEQREQMRERMDRGVPAELQATVRQLRENNRAAMREAREVLTPEQQALASELVRARAAEHMPAWRQFQPRNR
jgi:hypothetical protein